MANPDGMLPKGFGEILHNTNYVAYVAYHISSLICPYVRAYVNVYVNAIEGE